MSLPTLPNLFRFVLLAVLLVSGSLAGCASNKPEVNINKAQNFAAINTFYVQPPLNSVNVTVENHMAATITSIMQSKGLSPASESNADVAISFLPSSARKEDGTSFNIGLGTGVFGRSTGISLGSIFSVPVGEQVSVYQNLQIDVIKDGAFIYSAAGSTELPGKDSISIQQALTTLVGDLLASYPEKSASEQ